MVYHADNNNSVTVKFGMIFMAKIVFYTYFDVCMMNVCKQAEFGGENDSQRQILIPH